MIIKCDKCNTAFRLPDEKIKPEGTKVRCSKCKNLFIVFPPKPAQDSEPEEIEEKTRIAFVQTSFGDEKDDDEPITIKKQKESIPLSIESLGHGISLSSPEIKMIEDTDKDLNEIMSAIESGLSHQSAQPPVIGNDLPSISEKVPDNLVTDIKLQSEISKKDISSKSSDEVDSLLDSISDIIPPTSEKEPSKDLNDTQPEELPDLSALLTATIQDKSPEQISSGHSTHLQPKSPKDNLAQQSLSQDKYESNKAQSSPQITTLEDKLSIEIDKVFDSLFNQSEQQATPAKTSPQENQQARKTLLYMEAVPVAQQNQAQNQTSQKPHIENLNLTEELSLIDLPQPSTTQNLPQIQDNLLNDDLSMFLSTPNSSSLPSSKQPIFNTDNNFSQDLPSLEPLQNINIQSNPSLEAKLDFGSSFEFGQLGSDLPQPPTIKDSSPKFSPNANRSDDLLSQMNSIDDISPLAIPNKDIAAKSITQEPVIQTYEESGKVSQEIAKQSPAPSPIKPATIALKEDAKSTKANIVRWFFTIILAIGVGFASFAPSKVFPKVENDLLTNLRQSIVTDSISIENLYFRKINISDTLLVFTGSITLKKPTPPDNIKIKIIISDLSGSDIIEVESPLTYSNNFEKVINISNIEGVRDFLKENRIKMITQRKNSFITPIIINNIDIRDINVKASIIIASQ